MTVFNHEDYVKTAIKSILSQTFKKFELVIVNNGSTDSSKNIIKKFKNKKIKFYNLRKNIGRTNCLNFGLKKCKGKYIAIQDSDDIAKRERIKKQYNFLEKNENIALVGSNFNIIDENNKFLKKKIFKVDLYNNPNVLLFENIIAHSTVMYRKKILKKIGDYPSQIIYAQDYAFYLKIIKRYKITLLNKILANIRVNNKNSETFRLRKSVFIQIEQILLIIWIIKNIKINLINQIQIFLKIIIVILKIFKTLFKKFLYF